MTFLSEVSKSGASPDMPDVVHERELPPKNPKDYLMDSRLKAEHYEDEEKIVVKVETEALEGLLGYSIDDISSLLDEGYGTKFEETEFDYVEYGNGWAIFYREE